MLVVVLPEAVRFRHVEEVILRCGLEPFEHAPQVFPARPEPARVAWTTADGASTAEFRYAVNPDRRSIRFTGSDAEDLRRVSVATMGELRRDELEAAVLSATDEATAFRSAFWLAELLGEEAVEVLMRGATSRPDHAAWGCLRAAEPFLRRADLPVLQQIRGDVTRPAAVRSLAGAVAGALFHR